ncbi:hypothetical protein niasHT_039103 [Heterodera trifolii]|uniref:EGF-like domain-containing protein n=1 Tax=Heterodera trifolii TaxID=157864 RepID=A0ABD2I8B9_9BILA
MAMSFCCAFVGPTGATASSATEKNGQQISNTLSGHNDAQRSRRRTVQKAVTVKVGQRRAEGAEEAQTMLITSGRKTEQYKTAARQRRQIEQRWRHHSPNLLNWPFPLRRRGKCQQRKSSVYEGGLITVQICAIFSWLFPSTTAGFHQHRTSAATASSFFLSMLFLCLFILLSPKPAVTAYSAYSAVSRPCLSSEFECGCGQPRCVPSSVVSDGAADCADATDELEETWEDLCGDGTPSRRSATWRTRAGTARLCPKARARECPAELGQVCVEFDARPRCVCRLGFFRAPGLSACVPTEAFPHFDASDAFRLADALRRGEQPTTNSSCSRLFTDLARLYPALFLFNGREDAKNSSGGTIKQRDELMKTDRQLTIRVVSPARGASSTRARSPPDAGRQSDLDGTKRVVPTTEPEECDAEERTSGCGGDGRICAAMKQRDETADKRVKGTNGSDEKRKGICVVPVNECADETLNDCDQKARCIDNDFGFECLCPEGFIDTSPNPHEFPGRKCRKLINECLNPLMNDCSAEAECVDELIGFSCHCKPGRSDISPQGEKRPGRKCSTDSAQQRTNGVDECLLGLHDCHPLATCVDLTDGFRCECFDGLIDAASPAAGGDRPGRNCTAKNTSAFFETQADIGPSSVDRFFRCDSSNAEAQTGPTCKNLEQFGST